MSLHKWKKLAEKRRLVEQYYKKKDEAIKDYKLRRGVSSDFYEREAKPVIEQIGEQIKEQEEQAEKITEKRSPQDTLQTQIKVLIIIEYQININKYQNWLQ